MVPELMALTELPYFGKALYVFVVVVITIVFALAIDLILRRAYKRSLELKSRSRKFKNIHVIEKTKFNLLRRILTAVIYAIGLLMIISAFPSLKSISYSLLAGAGVLAIVIGFATQEVFSNIVAGIFISLFEPFRIDDRVTIGTDIGYIEDITLWHTVIRTFENQRLMIPNSIIAKEKIMNHHIVDPKTLNMIDFGISYDSDIDLAKKIISEEVKRSQYFFDNTQEHHYLGKEEPFKIRVVSHGDSSIGLRLYAWTENPTNGFLMKTELLETVKKRFDKEGVEIPFPYRTIVEKKLQPKNKRLRAATKRSAKKRSTKKRKRAKKSAGHTSR